MHFTVADTGIGIPPDKLEMISKWGLIHGEARDGEGALEEVKRAFESGDPYRLMLLDFQMPGMDGFELAEKVMESPYGAGLEQGAHKLKGSLAIMGAERAFDAAYGLEVIGREGKMQEAEHSVDLLLKELQALESSLRISLPYASLPFIRGEVPIGMPLALDMRGTL
ncbi:MAG TPA: response regulator [Desulfobacteraceae bacterium]|nr:response regulator [Desulfobacteraceae bacterium]